MWGAGCGNPILVAQPGLELMSPAVEVQSLNHWTTREVPPHIPSDPQVHFSELILKKYLSRYGKIDEQGSSSVTVEKSHNHPHVQHEDIGWINCGYLYIVAFYSAIKKNGVIFSMKNVLYIL